MLLLMKQSLTDSWNEHRQRQITEKHVLSQGLITQNLYTQQIADHMQAARVTCFDAQEARFRFLVYHIW